MQFIKAPCVAFATIVLITACGGNPTKEQVEEPVEVEEQAVVEGQEAVEAPFVKIPKPEAPKPESVPSAAKKEFSSAIKAMRDEKWQKAEGILTLMSETYPQLAGVYTNLGIVYGKLEQEKDAENAYRYAIDKNPHNYDAYTNLGVLLREQGRFEEAKATYQAALAIWPHHRPSIINLGILNDMYLGNLPEALANFQLAQNLSEVEDKKLKGWIRDIQRQLKQ